MHRGWEGSSGRRKNEKKNFFLVEIFYNESLKMLKEKLLE